jgi:hypothetical protein
MTPPRSVIDLLTEQPEDVLIKMRDSIRTELSRLTVEAQQVEQAIAKKSRRRPSSAQASNNGHSSGKRKLSRQKVFEIVVQAGHPLSTNEVVERLAAEGIEISSPNSVRNHLIRLVEINHWLSRTSDSRFAVVSDAEPEILEPLETLSDTLL